MSRPDYPSTSGLVVAVALNLLVLAVAAILPQGNSPEKLTIGTIDGLVRFEGTPPPSRPIHTEVGTLVPHPSVVVGPRGRLANVLVWVSKGLDSEQAASMFAPRALLDQRQYTFVPRVVVVQVGHPLAIRNSDPMMQCTKFTSTDNGVFSIGLPGQSPLVYERIFDRPEIGIRVSGEMHPWMRAYVHVLEHPYYAVTGEDGRFRFAKLPAGKYELSFWHESLALVPDKPKARKHNGIYYLDVTVGDRSIRPIVVTYSRASLEY